LGELYSKLTAGGTGTIITGFVFVSQAGRAMHPGQCGIESDTKTPAWKRTVQAVRQANPDTKLIMQLAHTGRQTLSRATGSPVLGASSRACTYFRQRPKVLDNTEIELIINQFANAAYRAKQAGFDGIQIHAAHGYLIHQFLSPYTNTRKDRWSNPHILLEEIIRAIRTKCGDSFPILAKLSGAEDSTPGIRVDDTIKTVKCLEDLHIDAIEISYGTMEYALNIIRGAVPVNAVLKVNPMFNRLPGFIKWLWQKYFAPAYISKFIPFTENYNLENASLIWSNTEIPIIAVGGIRTLESMLGIVNDFNIDAVALCRPLIIEPNLPKMIQTNQFTTSKCTNCNLCSVHCDSPQPLRCYQINPSS
jgi:2,4-dienoyl-CoA reductase-like NADH-dependent reductase (Old Yellow Enzyme family)